MRSGMVLACGITLLRILRFCGGDADNLHPPKANILMPSEAITPCQPLEGKAAVAPEVFSPVAGKLWPKAKDDPRPASIMAIIATTFTRDSQNSISPNTRVAQVHRADKEDDAEDPDQRGTSGYHNPI